MSVSWSTWPLNRCWVEGLGWAAETCSGSVDLSVQTEPSIIWMWQVCPWTPTYFICQQSLCAQCVHVKTSPGLKEVSHTFISCLFHLFSPSHTHTRPFPAFSGNCWSPSFLLSKKKKKRTTKAFGKGSSQLYLIICGRPNQGQLWWSHLHGFQVLPFKSA